MTLLEVYHDEKHDEALAAEIVRLQQELEQTIQPPPPASNISDGPAVAETQPPSDVSPPQTTSTQERLINTAPQTDFVDTSACYKYVESDDDCSGNGMLSYDEVTVDTNDEEFLFMVEDEVTVIEEEIIEDTEIEKGGNGVPSQQTLSSHQPTKKVPSLREHILSQSQHSRSSSSKQNTILDNPYSRYASAPSTDDDKSEQSDTFHDENNNKKHEIVLEEEDNQSCLSYDEITVTTAELMAELDHQDESCLINNDAVPVNSTNGILSTVESQNNSNSLPNMKFDAEEEEMEILDEDVLPVSSPVTMRSSVERIDQAKGTMIEDVLVGDTNSNIVSQELHDSGQISYVKTSQTPGGNLTSSGAPVMTAVAVTTSSTLPEQNNETANGSSFDAAWTNFGQNLIDPTRKRKDEEDIIPQSGNIESVHTERSEASLTNVVESMNHEVGDTSVSNNASVSQILSIDEQIRLMQEEILMSTPIKFQSPLVLPIRKKVGDSVVVSLDPAPILSSPSTDLKSPRNDKPVTVASSPKPHSSTTLEGSATHLDRSPKSIRSPERQKLKSPKTKVQQSPKALAGTARSATSPKIANRATERTQQSPKSHQLQSSAIIQKSPSPTKLDPPSQGRKTTTSTTPLFPKSPVEELSHLAPLNSLKSPPKSGPSPKNTMQESPQLHKDKARPNLPQLEHPYNTHHQDFANTESLPPETNQSQSNSSVPTSIPNVETNLSTETKKKKTKLVRKIRKKPVNTGTTSNSLEVESSNVIDQEALELQAQIDEMKAQIAALSVSAVNSGDIPPVEGSIAPVKENRPPPMFNLLGAIESAATKRVQRLEETGGELFMQDIAPEVEAKPTNNRQLSTSMAEMISQRAAARDKRLADGGEKRMRKVVIKEKDEYKKDFSSIVLDVAAVGRLTRLNEYTVEAVGQPKKPQEEWKSNGLLAIQWKSAHMSVIHDAAAAGNATKMPEYTVTNFPEDDRQHDVSLNKQSSTRMEKLLLLDTKVGEGLRKVDNFILGQKEHQSKLNSLLIKPMQSYSKVEDVQLPRESVPKIDPVKNAEKLSKMKREALMSGRPMIDISASAAERAWERRARLDRPGTTPKVKEACPCPYCKSASPYQTFAYRELERRKKENGEDVKHRHHRAKKSENLDCIEHQDVKSTDSDAAQVATKEEIDEIEKKRRERQRIREERRKLQQAVAEADAAIAKAAADAEILKKQLEVHPGDDILLLPTSLVGKTNTKKTAAMESAPSNTTPYSLVNDRAEEWNHTTTKPIPKKYQNQPPEVDSAKCTCTIM